MDLRKGRGERQEGRRGWQGREWRVGEKEDKLERDIQVAKAKCWPRFQEHCQVTAPSFQSSEISVLSWVLVFIALCPIALLWHFSSCHTYMDSSCSVPPLHSLLLFFLAFTLEVSHHVWLQRCVCVPVFIHCTFYWNNWEKPMPFRWCG